MTVKELIGMLEGEDSDTVVYVEDFYGNSYNVEGVTTSLDGDTLITVSKKIS